MTHRLIAVTSWLRFPSANISRDRRLEDALARFVWVGIPLEYYILTHIGGGIQADDIVAAALIALISVLGLIAISAIISLLPTHTGTQYRDKLSGWSLAALTSWAAALLIIAGCTYIGSVYQREDVFANVLCNNILTCADYPSILSIDTFVIYSCYVALSAIIASTAIRLSGGKQSGGLPGPYIPMVVILVAGFLTGMHGMSRLF